MIDLRLLGPTELTRDGVSVQSVLVQPKRLALLTYLALAHPGGFTRRDQLLALFWPESDAKHARNALRQALYRLRKSLGAEAILVRGEDEVGVDAEHIRIDAVELARAADRGDADRVLELRRGPLLEGLHLASAPEFGEWLDAERRRLDRRAWEAVLGRARDLESSGDAGVALPYARAASELRPLEEESAACLIRVLVAVGDRAAALARYARLEDDLATEFQATVGPDMRELGRRLREGRLREGGSDGGVREGAPGDGPVPEAAVASFADEEAAGSTQRPGWHHRVLVAAAGLVVAIVLAATGWLPGDPGPSLPEGAEIVLADPGGGSDDGVRALNTWFRLELQASEAVNLVSRGRVREVLRRMDRDPNGELTLPLALEVARRTGYEAVVLPTFAGVGDEWILSAEVYLPGRAEPLLDVQESASSPDGLADAVTRLSRKLRAELGESRAAIRQTDPLPEVTTASFEALQAYALGQRELQRSIWSAAVDHFRRATELDDGFASAWARLGEVQLVNGQASEAAASFGRAFVLLHRLPAGERPAVEFLYRFFAEGDVETARVVSASFIELYPDRRPRWLEQQMLLAAAQSDWAAGARHARDLLQSGTDFDALSWWLVVAHLFSAGDLEATSEALDRWESEEGPTSDVTGARFRVAWERGDWRETDQLIASDAGRRLAGIMVEYWRSHLALARGRVRESDRLFEGWLEVPGALSGRTASRVLAWRALVDLHIVGDTARARDRLAESLAGTDTFPALVLPTFAIAYAHLGDAGTAREILDGVDPELDEFESRRVRREYRSAQSAVLLADGRIDEALRAARVAVQTDLGGRTDCGPCAELALARALDRSGRSAEAIPWYESVRDDRWILGPSRQMDAAYLMPVRQRLAELYAQHGRPEDARRENETIVQEWGAGDAIAQRWVEAARARLGRAGPSGDR